MELQLRQSDSDMDKVTENKKTKYISDLDEFAYILSHDVSAPVRAMVGHLSMLEKSLQGKLNDKELEHIEKINAAKVRYSLLMNAINDYVRISTNHKSSAFVFASIDIINNAVKAFAQKKLVCDFDIEIDESNLPNLKGDSEQIYYLFWELIDNAIKYRDADRKLKIKISCDMDSTSGKSIFCFEDNGIGIEDKFFSKIFKIFRKLHHEKDYAGLGVGLAYAKKIVELHGGNIWLESVPNQGSKFFISLPTA